MTKNRNESMIELGDHTAQLCGTMAAAWANAKAGIGDPVALDKFALQAVTVSQALGIVAERAQQLAEELLDGEAD